MNIRQVIDFAREAQETVGRYNREFTLSPQQLMNTHYIVNNLNWDSISYGRSEIGKVPDKKRGVYAFAICQNSEILPPHGYILYIGMAGRNSDRTLRERYRDYLSDSKLLKRDRVAFMIGNWYEVLRFFFAPVDDDVSSEDLKALERQLNSALMPPFAEADLDAGLKRKRRAFR